MSRRKARADARTRTALAGAHAIMVVMSVATLYPLYFVVVTAF